jgi:hypothetical protein
VQTSGRDSALFGMKRPSPHPGNRMGRAPRKPKADDGELARGVGRQTARYESEAVLQALWRLVHQAGNGLPEREPPPVRERLHRSDPRVVPRCGMSTNARKAKAVVTRYGCR